MKEPDLIPILRLFKEKFLLKTQVTTQVAMLLKPLLNNWDKNQIKQIGSSLTKGENLIVLKRMMDKTRKLLQLMTLLKSFPGVQTDTAS